MSEVGGGDGQTYWTDAGTGGALETARSERRAGRPDRKRPEAEGSGRLCVVAAARSDRLHTPPRGFVVRMSFSR
jgi:hypothetical protein